MTPFSIGQRMEIICEHMREGVKGVMVDRCAEWIKFLPDGDDEHVWLPVRWIRAVKHL